MGDVINHKLMLEQRHCNAKAKIAAELKKTKPDQATIRSLKKVKLSLKDEMAALAAKENIAVLPTKPFVHNQQYQPMQQQQNQGILLKPR